MPRQPYPKRSGIFIAIPFIIFAGALYMALVMFVTAQAAEAIPRTPATIVDVIDGDTLRVNTPDCQRCRVRMLEIDAPEHDQPFGDQARAMLARLTGGAGSTVALAIEGTDRYGRLLAHVYRRKVNINWAMVRNGGAYVYEFYSNSESLRRLQAAAKRTGAGLWALAQSERVRPWDWRRGERTRTLGANIQATADALDDFLEEAYERVRDYFKGN